MTSVNTYTSVMGFSTEVKYLMTCLRENKKYGAKRLLKIFPNKNWSFGGLKTNAVFVGIHRTTVPVLSIFLFSTKIDNTGTVVRRIGQWLTSSRSVCTVRVLSFLSVLSVHQDTSFC